MERALSQDAETLDERVAAMGAAARARSRVSDELELVDLIGREAAYLSLMEIGLGSFLHALRVPFTGYFLSLNQAFFLSHAVSRGRALPRARVLPGAISLITALLKSLSPAGKKLTPMLAISMQGTLFTAGTIALGPTWAGVIAGAVLSSLWAFAQPLLLLWLLYGQDLGRIAAFYEEKFGLSWVLAGLVGAKAVLALALALAGFTMSERRFGGYRERMLRAARGRAEAGHRMGGSWTVNGETVTRAKDEATDPPGWSEWKRRISMARGALRDLFNPLFVLSLAASAVFFVLAEVSFAQLAWLLMRPVAVGFALFFALRMVPLERVAGWLERSRLDWLARALHAAVRGVRGGDGRNS
jgi:hypothetical protein